MIPTLLPLVSAALSVVPEVPGSTASWTLPAPALAAPIELRQDAPPPPPMEEPAPATKRRRFRVELEGGAAWQSNNDVQIPGDTGTRFSMIDYQGNGPFPVGRFTFDADVSQRHGLRLVYQPLRTSGTGTSNQDVSFENQDFPAGVPTDARYQFDTWRLTWRYRFHESRNMEWRVGATLLVRDAAISLAQPGVSAERTDLGVVPLAHIDGWWRFADRWRLLVEFDGLVAPQGRAFDFSTKVGYDLSDQWTIAAGYRTIEGGADNDEVFNFAWFHAAVVSVSYAF